MFHASTVQLDVSPLNSVLDSQPPSSLLETLARDLDVSILLGRKKGSFFHDPCHIWVYGSLNCSVKFPKADKRSNILLLLPSTGRHINDHQEAFKSVSRVPSQDDVFPLTTTLALEQERALSLFWCEGWRNSKTVGGADFLPGAIVCDYVADGALSSSDI